MTKIKLKQNWTLGPQFEAGGFGRVFEAKNDQGDDAVVKLVPKAPGADRELLFVNLEGFEGVIPVIDSGEHKNYWVLVMPRADRSLRQHLRDAGGALNESEANELLTEIAAALAEIDGKVVHRDLKPENILYWQGRWRLADFGISRYAEATTAADTQKYALSPPYAAPERWRAERATIAADIYALGVIAFEVLSGTRPFVGPSHEDFREQHLHVDAPTLQVGTRALKGLVSEALFKAPGARPSPANMVARLQRSQEQRAGGLSKLEEAHLGVVAQRSEEVRAASAAQTEANRRSELFKSASTLLDNLYAELKEAITAAAPSLSVGRGGKRNGSTLTLGTAQMELVPITKTVQNPWEWSPPSFDVIAHAGVIIRIPRDRYDFEGRSHSLWYCDAFQAGKYEWMETALMVSPLVRYGSTMRPFLADPGPEAAKALWSGMAEVQLAWPLEVVDKDSFIDRWSGWLGDAAQGRLTAPSMMPERPTPRNWRSN